LTRNDSLRELADAMEQVEFRIRTLGTSFNKQAEAFNQLKCRYVSLASLQAFQAAVAAKEK
jgi:chaperonin cofactor prefoldin